MPPRRGDHNSCFANGCEHRVCKRCSIGHGTIVVAEGHLYCPKCEQEIDVKLRKLLAAGALL